MASSTAASPAVCLEFHPLAKFGALNARVAAGDADGAERLADALVARGVHQSGGGIGWEYTSSSRGGRAPWISGMAQAVAAQAFARAADLVPDETTSLMRAGAGAYQAIPRGAAHVGRRRTMDPALFVPTRLPVLNAQLQTVALAAVVCDDAEDADAAALAVR